MTPIERQIIELQEHLEQRARAVQIVPQPSGAYLVEIADYRLPQGWNRDAATILFLAPAGYPAAQPDCFWIVPAGLRLKNGATPQNTNDMNPVPGYDTPGTWFSWHLQSWEPNRDTLVTYFGAITQRLSPAR